MSSFIYNSALFDEANGDIDYGADSFKCMLVGSGYTPNRDTHTKRSDVTSEVSGSGYVTGGVAVSVSVGAVDQASDKVEITLGTATWDPSSISGAVGAVYYKDTGDSAADQLVAFFDFGLTAGSTNAKFEITTSTLRKQNT